MTVFAKWDEKFSVGSTALDKQHGDILNCINELNDALMTRHGERVARSTLERLEEYVKVHFAAEEALLRKTAYPDLQAQINQHRFFEQEVRVLASQCVMGADFAPSFFVFLRDWLVEHMLEMNVKYKGFLPPSAPHHS